MPRPGQVLETLTRSLLPRRGTSRNAFVGGTNPKFSILLFGLPHTLVVGVNPKDARSPYSPSLTGRLTANGHPTAGVSL